MKKILLCAALAVSTTTLHAAMLASAYISCPSCVTANVEWFGEPFPISWVEVDDSFGTMFVLNVGSPMTTGFILPNPQTVSGLSPDNIYYITNGQAGFTIESIHAEANTFATVNLFDAPPGDGGHVIDHQVLVASLSAAAVPEPAAWSLTAAGMALLFLGMKRRRRNSQT